MYYIINVVSENRTGIGLHLLVTETNERCCIYTVFGQVKGGKGRGARYVIQVGVSGGWRGGG